MEPVVRLGDVTHRYGARYALDGSRSKSPPAASRADRPDGVGKSTSLALAAGARRCQSGDIRVLGTGMRLAPAACGRTPSPIRRGSGQQSHPDLSIAENIDFFARLFGRRVGERDQRIAELLESTGSEPFADPPAKNLSGGMRQKLGLCCSLIHDPNLLILDEPTTVVVRPRRQFLDLIERMRLRRPGIS